MEPLEQQLAGLSLEQRRLVERWLRQEQTTAVAAPHSSLIPRRSTTDAPPLSFAQQRFWFLQQLEPRSPAYNLRTTARLAGPLDLALLARSLNAIVRRHEALRTTFHSVDEQLRQVIAPATPLALCLLALDELPPPAHDALVQQLARSAAAQPFDLEQGPLLRVRLLRLAPDAHVLLLTMHHIIADGWSQGVLLRELTALYAAFLAGRPAPLPELPIQYADYACWQRAWLQGSGVRGQGATAPLPPPAGGGTEGGAETSRHGDKEQGMLDSQSPIPNPQPPIPARPLRYACPPSPIEAQLAYWKAQLEGPLPALELPCDRPRPPHPTDRGAVAYHAFPATFRDQLQELSRREGVTLFMTLLAAFAVLLYRYSGQDEIVVGSPSAGRNRAELEGLIGVFVNMLALRIRLGGNPPFRELLQRVRTVALGAYAHQELPFEKLIEALHLARDLSRHPIFQVMLVLQNVPMPALSGAGLTLIPLEIETSSAVLDLALYFREWEHELQLRVEYSTDLFDASTIERLLGHLRILLAAVVAAPDQRLGALPLLSAAEQQQLLLDWNATAVVYPQGQSIASLFEAQVARAPDAIALVCDRGQGSGVRGQEATPLPPPARGGTGEGSGSAWVPPPAGGGTEGGSGTELPPPACGGTGEGSAWASVPPPAGGGTEGGSGTELPPPAGGRTEEGSAWAWVPPPAGGGTEGGKGSAWAALSPQSSVLSPQHLTYRELNSRANRLAHHLRALGVGLEVRVGICLARSLEAVLALLAVLKAGGAYVPLDPSYPPERLAFMLEDSLAAVLITTTDDRPTTNDQRPTTNLGEPRTKNQEPHDDGELKTQNLKLKTQESTPSPCHFVTLSRSWPTIAAKPPSNPACPATLDNAAYLIYTSGSTGRPKAVIGLLRGLLNRVGWMQQLFPFGEGEVACHKTALGFVDSVWELFGPLLHGTRLVLIADALLKDPPQLLEALARERVTRTVLVPALLDLLLRLYVDLGQRLPALRLWVVSGEALSVELVERFRAQLPERTLLNLYGSSEVAADVSWYDTAEWRGRPAPIAIGRPIANTQLYVLDERQQVVPVGVVGGLYVGGAGLARGYHQRAGLTAERFVPNPFGGVLGDGCWVLEDSAPNTQHPTPNTRLYWTGDLARYRADGVIEYRGRVDRQVKLRGVRIELGEIEAALRQHPALRAAVVLAREDVRGEKRLVAYIVPKIEDRRLKIEDSNFGLSERLSSIFYPLSSELHAFLLDQLPEYMVPSTFVLLPDLPLNPNGKIDLHALPPPEQFAAPQAHEFVAPRTRGEQILAEIWAGVLGVKQVGVYDDFFALGGDSFLSMRIVARASQSGLRISPRQLFQHRTIAELALLVDTTPAVLPAQGPLTGPVRLLPAQHRFFENPFIDRNHCNVSALLEVRQALNPTWLARCIQYMLLYHDALRLRFVQEPSGWRQLLAAPAATIPFTQIDLSMLPEPEQGPAIGAAAAALQASLDLAQGPLLRVALFDLGAEKPGRLLIVMHHLATDGFSMRVLLEDVQTAYRQLEQGEAIQLPAKTTSLRDWAERLARYAQSAELRRELADWLTLPWARVQPLPLDYPAGRNENIAASSQNVPASLSVEETQALLHALPAGAQSQFIGVLLTALLQAFTRWTQSPALLVCLVGHGREALLEDADLSRTIGWFNTHTPVLLELAQPGRPHEALAAVQQQLGRIPNHGIGFDLLRYLHTDTTIRAQLRALPQPEVVLIYHGMVDLGPEPGLLRRANEAKGSDLNPLNDRTYLLVVNGSIAGGRLQFIWTYSENFHRRATIERLAHDFLAALRAFVADTKVTR